MNQRTPRSKSNQQSSVNDNKTNNNKEIIKKPEQFDQAKSENKQQTIKQDQKQIPSRSISPPFSHFLQKIVRFSWETKTLRQLLFIQCRALRETNKQTGVARNKILEKREKKKNDGNDNESSSDNNRYKLKKQERMGLLGKQKGGKLLFQRNKQEEKVEQVKNQNKRVSHNKFQEEGYYEQYDEDEDDEELSDDVDGYEDEDEKRKKQIKKERKREKRRKKEEELQKYSKIDLFDASDQEQTKVNLENKMAEQQPSRRVREKRIKRNSIKEDEIHVSNENIDEDGEYIDRGCSSDTDKENEKDQNSKMKEGESWWHMRRRQNEIDAFTSKYVQTFFFAEDQLRKVALDIIGMKININENFIQQQSSLDSTHTRSNRRKNKPSPNKEPNETHSINQIQIYPFSHTLTLSQNDSVSVQRRRDCRVGLWPGERILFTKELVMRKRDQKRSIIKDDSSNSDVNMDGIREEIENLINNTKIEGKQKKSDEEETIQTSNQKKKMKTRKQSGITSQLREKKNKNIFYYGEEINDDEEIDFDKKLSNFNDIISTTKDDVKSHRRIFLSADSISFRALPPTWHLIYSPGTSIFNVLTKPQLNSESGELLK
ncbi:MAG: hypothetical protein EZS28_010505 [Streblomastix strix]|uniref:Uncharacterized protein n=1 Tax=Streblomastix strix TaxID=222440 RepID=A0A5J4WI32_9EUKA|nr:MAG: hypothetical protein EZS28_010505 [Streblomastix strix]